MSLLHKRSSIGTRKVSPPQPTCMSDEQKASYLTNLRNNRPARPTGSRPLPSKPAGSRIDSSRNALSRSESANLTPMPRDFDNNPGDLPLNHSTSAPTLSHQKGRPLARAPQDQAIISPRKSSPPSMAYTESLARQIEKREAHSLREALEKIDIEDEESRIHSAAQMEAADLVWKHRNPNMAEHEKIAAYRNPDLVKKRYVVGNRESSSEQPAPQMLVHEVSGDSMQDLSVQPLNLSRRKPQGIDPAVAATDKLHSSRRRSSGARKISSGSAKGVFRNPEDQIYEEEAGAESVRPEQRDGALPLQPRTRNSLPRTASISLEKSEPSPIPTSKRVNLFEIHRNPPSQSRNAAYALNHTPPRQHTPEESTEISKGRAMEIRSDEIRAATSMKRKDRSPKLPTPTAVSDKPGRPIVSFDPAWKPVTASQKGSLDLDREKPIVRPMPSIPKIAIAGPSVPMITLSETPDVVHDGSSRSVPHINLPEDEDTSQSAAAVTRSPIPIIEVQCETSESAASIPTIAVSEAIEPTRPLPAIQHQNSRSRPLPSHSQSTPSNLPSTNPARNSRLPWLSRRPDSAGSIGGRSSTVTCTACDLPISGRIVTASGSANSVTKARFHPECFNCFHCSTALECVSFYPEPESALMERLKAQCEEANDSQDERMEAAPPTASDLRFYCHLDFHELFSPKCASCHTPIEGSIILAAGKAWHEGHFFCAECGDPFSSSSPFVEAKGYAYCVTCHTRRTASRCRGCKNQILDEVSVEALGGKWHEACFVCFECERDFGPEGRFFIREIEIDLTEKEKRKGADYRKIEERAVCERCEERRLKSWNIRAPAGGSSLFV